jgi:hypothetical protein
MSTGPRAVDILVEGQLQRISAELAAAIYLDLEEGRRPA